MKPPKEDPLDIARHALERTGRYLEEEEHAIGDLRRAMDALAAAITALVKQALDLDAEHRELKMRYTEMESERNQYRSLAEDLGNKYRAAAARAGQLAVQTGEARCSQCGSAQLVWLHGSFPTGVVAPDGGVEAWYESAVDCQECGHREELAP